MVKKYSAAHVKNPTSLQHIVWLQPGQTLILHLEREQYPEVKVESNSPYLKILPCEGNQKEQQFIFVQEESVVSWGQYSSSFLGDVWVDSGTHTAKLVVMMNCTSPTKQRFCTVVNPDCTDIRIRPYHIIEVVLFDHRFKDQDEWIWEWVPKSDMQIEMLGYEYLNMHMWRRHYEEPLGENPEFAYARLLRGDAENNPWMRQHHFWFRFKENILSSLEGGVKNLGDLKFYGWPERLHRGGGNAEAFFKPNDWAERFLSLHVDLQKKYREETMTSLAVRPQKEYGASAGYISRPVQSAVKTYLKKRRQQSVPMAHDVSLNVIEEKTFDGGCRTLDAMPPEELPDGDDPTMEYGPQHHGYQHHGYPHHGFSGYGTMGHRHYHFERHEMYDWWD